MNLLRSIRSDPDRPDGRVTAIFAVIVACLWAARFTKNYVPESWSRLSELSWWAGTQIVFYAIVPITVLALIGIRPSEIGWRVSGMSRHGTLYLGLFAIAFPFVLLASRSADFQAHYPILEISPGQTGVWGDLAIWWPLYALQFVAIEAFFRGVLVLGLAQRFGSSAVFIGVVPYMMIHFVKPPAEAAASVIGGVVLGCLALRTRSIVWGMALHVAIAATMDLAALGHKGFLW